MIDAWDACSRGIALIPVSGRDARPSMLPTAEEDRSFQPCPGRTAPWNESDGQV